jgi:dUTP pyrophosphatase
MKTLLSLRSKYFFHTVNLVCDEETYKMYENSDSIGSEYSTGFDIRSCKDIMIETNSIAIIPTGCYLEYYINEFEYITFDIQVRSRSGLSCKGIVVNNSPGTIDIDYKDEIKIILRNQNNESHKISRGDKIAQIVVGKALLPNSFASKELKVSSERTGGFGSTGIS